MDNQEKIVLDMITKQGPIKSYKLENASGLKGQAIRQLVNQCRCSGLPVMSGHKGYWIDDSHEAIDGMIKDLRGRCNAMERAISGLESAKTGKHHWDNLLKTEGEDITVAPGPAGVIIDDEFKEMLASL